ncbi:universal stress protein [Arthrobacter sp. CJ23]|uniref:universal stress protein n=1 Tax=Arthrobacter sp. CJ23 TaxID=2972479 RepID=UPI00215B8FA0|nr:universal stress protein [Arthrobacter sp. CJ23]UVJ41271.1 universal stress protein [Arthrobacter sp. CJ23]
METTERIIVGYDGSPEAAPAVRWAAEQAALRGLELHLVHCSLWPAITHNMAPVPGVADSGLRHAAEAVVTEGAALALEASPDLDLTTSLVYGWPAENLRRLSPGAAMIVVGSRGIGGFMGLLVGSVSLELASTADCPVAVVRPGTNPSGPVVVGIDTQGWGPALHQASTLAALFGTTLRIVHVHTGHGKQHAPGDSSGVPDAREVLDSAVRSAAPGLLVEERLLAGTSVAGTLLGEANDARVIVVGTTGHGLIRGSIGSTAHAVLHHASCPVLVVREAPPAA